MAFETEPERILNYYVYINNLKEEFSYIEYGQDFIRFKKEGGKMYEIKVSEVIEKELKPRKEKQKKLIIKKELTVEEYRRLRNKK